jgi:hypothetical protein
MGDGRPDKSGLEMKETVVLFDNYLSGTRFQISGA